MGASADADRRNKRQRSGAGAVRAITFSSVAGRASGDDEVAKISEFLVNVARLGTQTAAEVRSLKAILISVAIVPRMCRIASLMFAAQKQYNDATKGKQGHGLGCPEHWAFKALLKALNN